METGAKKEVVMNPQDSAHDATASPSHLGKMRYTVLVDGVKTYETDSFAFASQEARIFRTFRSDDVIIIDRDSDFCWTVGK